jgi:uncharacterized membrane protein YqjE
MPSNGIAFFVCLVALARLVAFAIDDQDRWMRFLVLVLLVLAVAGGWWLLAGGVVQVSCTTSVGRARRPAR